MNANNYLHNQLLTRCNSPDFILKEAWITIRQNLEHVRIFESKMSTLILIEKCTKSDIQKTWRGFLIGYIETSKYLRVWASYIYQLLIASKPIVNKDDRNADLLLDYLLFAPPKKPLQLQTNEPKPRSWPRKNVSKNIL